MRRHSAESLKRLLLACVIHPLYLRSVDGIKFISFLFSLYHPFVDDLHLTIKAQVRLIHENIFLPVFRI